MSSVMTTLRSSTIKPLPLFRFTARTYATPASRLSFHPLPLPQSADADKLKEFGRVVKGFDPETVTDSELSEIHKNLYNHGVLLFKNTAITPKQQYELTRSFDPTVTVYGHGTTKPSDQKQSILHPDLKTIPHQPQVQLIGNGLVKEHHGLINAQLKHPHHKTFHKTVVSQEDEDMGITRFYRWHIDAALYDLAPPKVTTLSAIKVPQGPTQIVRYDDGTGDELEVPLGTTAFVSGKVMFDILPPEYKSLAVRTKVEYAPHPYVWMSKAKSNSTGLGLETEGNELSLDQLPAWSKDKVKILPMLWKNPENGDLHLQAHPSGAMALHIAPIPEGQKKTEKDLYPDGDIVHDLKTVREILYKMQRPGIAPDLVYPVDWQEHDLALFHNRGVLHSVVGAFAPDQVRMFHQCNLASSSDPEGPDAADVAKYTA